MVILHEDDYLIVLNKPAGQIVIPGRGANEREPLVRQVDQYLGAKAYIVHRLDKETSGVILFAKDAATHRDLNIQFERREVHKVYFAVVQGIVERDGNIQQPIRQFGSGRVGIDSKGQAALTNYRVIERFKDCTLLEIVPETGRRHQIRVHLYAVGHPILGDPLYGQHRPVGGAARLMLHAYEITFRHPSGAIVTFRAEPGADWIEVQKIRS
jgi:tRNA pseudouridine32 synthase/23S rRNA pseudouridine746 synthase